MQENNKLSIDFSIPLSDFLVSYSRLNQLFVKLKRVLKINIKEYTLNMRKK